MYKDVERVCDIKCILGESPCWNDINSSIYWVDIVSKKINIFNLRNSKTKIMKLNKYIGAIGFRKNGEIVAALEDGFYFIEDDSCKEILVKIINENLNVKRFNDGKIDANGNFWAGTVSLKEDSPIGVMYCLESNLNLKEVFNKITISNGIAWSVDNKKMYFIDSPTLRVDVFDFDIFSCRLRNRKPAFEIPKNIGYPDGMTIDIEGKLWIAHWGGNKVCRWDPELKKIIETIDIPASRVSSCTFGGEKLDELFITTAIRGFAENTDGIKEEDSGYLYRIQTGTRGMQSFKFNS